MYVHVCLSRPSCDVVKTMRDERQETMAREWVRDERW